jgi:hypothetical protein
MEVIVMNKSTNKKPKVPKLPIVLLVIFGILAPLSLLSAVAFTVYVNDTPDSQNQEVETTETCPDEEDCEDIKFPNSMDYPNIDKPIIYIYPEEETIVHVQLGNPDDLICSYPQYDCGWNVIAKPNGDLIDLKTGRGLYALYYESRRSDDCDVMMPGFVVPKEDTISFLEAKLQYLGLNEHEAEEFIIYWLPILQQNEYNYIRFATKEEIDNTAPLTVSPMPDTTIRVLMYFAGLDQPVDIEEQQLAPAERNGFTVVEWGGSQLAPSFQTTTNTSSIK